MPATVRVHRGPASDQRVLVMGSERLGPLSEPITVFTVPEGRHLFSLELGRYHSVGSWVTLTTGDEVDLVVEDDANDVAPLLQGGFLRFHPDPEVRHPAWVNPEP